MRSPDGEPLKSKAINADRKVLETVEELVAVFRREFGGHWQAVFRETVNVELGLGQS